MPYSFIAGGVYVFCGGVGVGVCVGVCGGGGDCDSSARGLWKIEVTLGYSKIKTHFHSLIHRTHNGIVSVGQI